jgi:hypothetical protein
MTCGSIAELGAVLLDKRLGLPQRLGRADVKERRIDRAYFEQAALRDQLRKDLLLKTQRQRAGEFTD